jgi:hypothetical protein
VDCPRSVLFGPLYGQLRGDLTPAADDSFRPGVRQPLDEVETAPSDTFGLRRVGDRGRRGARFVQHGDTQLRAYPTALNLDLVAGPVAAVFDRIRDQLVRDEQDVASIGFDETSVHEQLVEAAAKLGERVRMRGHTRGEIRRAHTLSTACVARRVRASPWRRLLRIHSPRSALLLPTALQTRQEVEMGVLWALVLLLIIFAIVGGAAFNSWLFLIIVIAVILALAGAF